MTNETGDVNPPTIIKLAKIKQWIIPADAESYKVLAKAGAPLTIFHEDFLPTLRVLTESKNIRGEGVNFRTEILEPFLDKVGATWNKKEHCQATIRAKTMTFELLKTAGFAKARASVPKLQEVLYNFFERWGYRVHFVYSEARGKLKLEVEYWHDPSKHPVISLDEKQTKDQHKVQFKLGNLRFTFKFDDFESKTAPVGRAWKFDRDDVETHIPTTYHIGYVHTVIEIKKGGEFVPFHSSRCKYSDISSVLPVITALMSVPQFNPHNFDVEPD